MSKLMNDQDVQIVTMLRDGKSTEQIEAALLWYPGMVRNRLKTLRNRLGAANDTHLVILAIRRGYLDID